ncbi:MAG: hypothetical protein ABT940_00415 [Alphaproteobacteria bacterium]
MSSTSQVTTFSDIYTDLQNRVRVATGITATETQAKRYCNIALQDIHIGTDYVFPWTERRAFLTTKAPYTTGTVSIAAGSLSLTGSGTAWNTANTYNQNNLRVGSKLTIAGATDIYRVSAVSGDTAATLETRYVASSDASAAEYRAFEDEYALASDFLRPIDFALFSTDWNIPLLDRKEFRRLHTRGNISGKPTSASILDLSFSGSTTPVRKVVFYPYPDQTYIIPYSYVTSNLVVTSAGVEQSAMSSDTDEPMMPLRYRHIIVLHALANWYRDKRDDARSQEAKAEFGELMSRMIADHDMGTHNRVRIQPNEGLYRAHAVRPYRRQGGTRYSTSNRFDSFR